MQDKINSFNAAFVDLAAAYVERLRLKIVQASVITVAEKRAGTARIDEPDWKIQLPDQVRIADCLAASVGRIEDRMERRRNADADKQPKEAADKLDFLRDFLEGKTRWTFPEGTTFNVTVDVNGTSGMETTQKGAEKEPLRIDMDGGPERIARFFNPDTLEQCTGEEEVYRRAHRRDLLEEWIERDGVEKCHAEIDRLWRLKGGE